MSFLVIDPDLARALLREPPPPAAARGAQDGPSDQGPLAALVGAFAALAALSAALPWS
jgi:hypothetical protein